MSLNKKILQKISAKTKDSMKMQTFIINILLEENKGLGRNGRYTKFYNDELEKATEEGINEN